MRRAVPIFASDVSFRMVDFARRNAERAGVAQAIEFKAADALQRPPPGLPPGLHGTLMLNPPYGERIEGSARRGATAARGLRRGPRPPAEDSSARLAAHWKRAYTTLPAGPPGC